jgi:hypothetical protein
MFRFVTFDQEYQSAPVVSLRLAIFNAYQRLKLRPTNRCQCASSLLTGESVERLGQWR